MAVKTYNPKQVKMSYGTHMITGYSDDTFIQVEPNSDGTSTVVGCDGEVNRAIGTDQTYKVTITLLQNSPSDKYFANTWDEDQEQGTGIHPLMIRDIMGEEEFSADECWIEKPANWERGKDISKRDWVLHTGAAKPPR